MAARYGAARVVLRPGNPDVWRVLVGAESDHRRRRRPGRNASAPKSGEK